MIAISPPSFYTKSILAGVLPKYCRGKAADVGAGRGKYRELIKKYADSYFSIDDVSSQAQFGEAQYVKKLDLVCDVMKIPLPDQSFDTVVCTEVLEHVPNPFLLMAELSRILKKDGHLILSSGWLSLYHPEPKDYFRFSQDAYQYLCSLNGLEIIEVNKKGNYLNMLLYLVFLRRAKLHGKFTKKVFIRTRKIIYLIERFLYWLGKNSQSEDCLGHLIVARKK